MQLTHPDTILPLAMGLGDDFVSGDGAAETIPKKGEKGKRSGDTLAPWDQPAAKLLRCGKKSAIDSAESLDELWNFMKEGTDYLKYHSEFCSQEPVVRGVALSRFAQGLAALCTAIQTSENLPCALNVKIYTDIKAEAETLLTYINDLNGAGLPVRAAAAKSMLGSKPAQWRDAVKVEGAIKKLKAWLDQPSVLRQTINAVQLGGLFYTVHVDICCVKAYLCCGHGLERDGMVSDARARLCQGTAASSSAHRNAISEGNNLLPS